MNVYFRLLICEEKIKCKNNILLTNKISNLVVCTIQTIENT